MEKTLLKLCLALLISIGMSSCEKPVIDDVTPSPVDDGFAITFNITHFEQAPFATQVYSRASNDAADVCTHINLAVFSGDTKVKAINQTSTDADFGKLSVNLQEGNYTVVILAHSCQGNATITSPAEIKFPNNKVTDTFFYCQDISVGQNQSLDVVLHRAVAMFELNITDNMPAEVNLMTFKYTGGSSTFNALTGYGCVNSRQTETRDVTADMHGKPSKFQVYTFPHEAADKLKITATASGAGEAMVAEREFDEVPVEINQITRYTGEFFSGSSQSESNVFRISIEDEWHEANYDF